MMTHGNGPSYAIHMSQQTKAYLKQLHLQANQVGRGAEFVAAFRHVIERLRQDPWTFGEPSFRLPGLPEPLRGTRRHGCVPTERKVHHFRRRLTP
jgi:hypothetical protein